MIYTLQTLKQELKKDPQGALALNLKKYPVDYKSLAGQNSRMFNKLISIMSESYETKKMQMWENYFNADSQLQEEGFYQLNFTEHYPAEIKALRKRVEGVSLIPLKSLIECVIRKGDKREPGIKFDYSMFAQTVEKHYQIKLNDFFERYSNAAFERRIKGFYAIASNEVRYASPEDSQEAAKARLVVDWHMDISPEVHFLYHLKDHDFKNNTWIMSKNPAHDSQPMAEELYALFREIFFKEAKALPILDNAQELVFQAPLDNFK